MPPFADSTLFKGLNTTVLPISLNYGSGDTTFIYDNLKPGIYGYLGVAQLTGKDILNDWKVVGFAHDALDSAIAFDLHSGEHIQNVDITVRFDSLPRQPFTK